MAAEPLRQEYDNSDESDASPSTLEEHIADELQRVESLVDELQQAVLTDRQKYLNRAKWSKWLYWSLGWPSALLAAVTGTASLASNGAFTTLAAFGTAAPSVSLNVFKPATSQSIYLQAADDLNALNTRAIALHTEIQDADFDLGGARFNDKDKVLADLRRVPRDIRAHVVLLVLNQGTSSLMDR